MSAWHPRRAHILAIIGAVAAAMIFGLATGDAVRESRSSSASAAASPGVTSTPVPSLNARFNYSIAFPPRWRRSESERTVPSDAGHLLDRSVFTARAPAEEARFAGGQFLPWDLFIEVWDRGGRSAEDWARQWCADVCDVTHTTINGSSAVLVRRPWWVDHSSGDAVYVAISSPLGTRDELLGIARSMRPLATAPSASATSTPASQLQPTYPLSGRVVRLFPGGVVVDSAGRQFEVSFSSMKDVWRDTSVAPSAIEVGDDLFIYSNNGTVSVNAGRVDGVIREIDATGMVVDVQGPYGPRGPQRIDFSQYIEYGAPSASISTTRADLVVGRTIGAVVHRRPGNMLRATRVWISQ